MNSLVESHPELLEEWDYKKNIIKPSEVSYGSGKKVWWRCKKGHSWRVRVLNRTNGKTGCPFCSGYKASEKNNIALTHPELLEEWNYEKNILKPSEISRGSNKKVWWKCKKSHSWEASPNARVYMKTGCPHCCVHKASNKNSLAIKYPELIHEWDYKKNIVNPEEISYESKKKVWWKCKNHHSWKDRIDLMVLKKTACPYCPRKKD